MPYLSSFLVVILLVTLASETGFAKYENPRFSPDEQYLAFDYCEDTCGFAVMHLESGRAAAFVKPKNDGWIHPSFGPSSDLLTFIVSPGPGNAQVAIARMDGTGFKLVTNSPTTKRSPSFSPDGSAIAFAGNEYVDSARKGGQGLVDVYIADVASGAERRITDLRVLGMGGPFFTPDGKQIVFSTVGSARPRSRNPAPILDLQKVFRTNVFAVRLVGEPTLYPYVHDLAATSGPMPIRTGEIALLATSRIINPSTKMFDYDVYLLSPNYAQRLTRLGRYIRSYGVAPSGRSVAFVTKNAHDRREDARLMLWRKETNQVTEIVLNEVTLIDVRR